MMKNKAGAVLVVMAITLCWYAASCGSQPAVPVEPDFAPDLPDDEEPATFSVTFPEKTDDMPYLSDEDIAAIEMTLPDDVPYLAPEPAVDDTAAIEPAPPEDIPDTAPEPTTPVVVVEAEKIIETTANEKSRLNTAMPLYHLLILDRIHCASNADISGIESHDILYKLKHGMNGYLVALYKSPSDGPVFPVLPDKARILLDLMTSRPETIKEYINSSAFGRFVKTPEFLMQIKNVVENDF
jgi:hypothetical protein